jgi:aryl-phospho-beta-D-glucosidase BglC (GH1 family)
LNTYNPGYNNLIPVIVVNGAAIGNAEVIGGQTSSFNWMKVRSPLMAAGNNTIKILFSGSYYVLKVDEINFFEF